ncbi:hypothetical protein C2S53_004318 [Perilla frutescens var. hirtella]|uniref:F-box/LRR-repeat protein 15/At3g58940/PEG3-like LRR domain-containing protein n=1 Tax=Perilla frutescens var. hirtella TaxID=608512 RepID=A0AAD4IP19_PERFH|nr:hypothetical protein C2S53_004318 [Perilla frutescens var. hirtella]
MSDVVRTTILSKRWKNLWTTADCLNFQDCMMDTADKVRTFIYRALTLWKGSKILKFRIRFDYHLKKSLYSDIDIWLRFATEIQVEELYVELKYPGDDCGSHIIFALKGTLEEMYCVPQRLYLCSSLKKLDLLGCNLKFHGNVHWNQLDYLHIYGGITQHVIDQVLSGSPQLETLSLYLLENYENLSIQCSSLKHLYIEKFLYGDDDVPSMNTELIIRNPELHLLEILGVPYSKCLLMNAPCLSEVTLGFDAPLLIINGNDFLEKTLIQILPTIQLVEELKLSDWCIKVLGAMKKKSMLQPLLNVKVLVLNNECFQEYENIVCLLAIFPELEMLVLQPKNEDFAPNRIVANNAKSCPRLEGSLPESFLLQLRIVKVTWTNRDDSIFPFIEIVLKYASNLKKMVFRVAGTAPPNSLLLASKKLLGMPRSSPTAEIIFSEF